MFFFFGLTVTASKLFKNIKYNPGHKIYSIKGLNY